MSGDMTEQTQPKAANSGPIRPPLVYLGAIAIGLLLHALHPLSLYHRGATWPIGAMIALGAIVLFVSSVRAFRKSSTPVPGNMPTTTIVRSGPYRWSRNPIYLSFSLFQLGAALCVNSLWIVVTLLPSIALMSFVVIRREERYLEAHFPADYLPYKATVRRWI